MLHWLAHHGWFQWRRGPWPASTGHDWPQAPIIWPFGAGSVWDYPSARPLTSSAVKRPTKTGNPEELSVEINTSSFHHRLLKVATVACRKASTRLCWSYWGFWLLVPLMISWAGCSSLPSAVHLATEVCVSYSPHRATKIGKQPLKLR